MREDFRLVHDADHVENVNETRLRELGAVHKVAPGDVDRRCRAGELHICATDLAYDASAQGDDAMQLLQTTCNGSLTIGSLRTSFISPMARKSFSIMRTVTVLSW